MSIEQNLQRVLDQVAESARLAHRAPDEILLVAVTKGRSLDEIKELYTLGVRDFGENRVDEAVSKMEQLPKDIRWHFIGKLQKNKVQKVIGRFALIHSVDSVELAEKLSRSSLERDLTSSILLEANTSGEQTKGGLPTLEWKEKYQQLQELDGINIEGLMTMAPLTEDEGRIRHCFSQLRRLKEQLGGIEILSMGMSNDFSIAIQEGSTLLRIGTALFAPQ